MLSVMIKPVSGSCNMHCDYCFYRDEMTNRKCRNYGVMDTETLSALLDKVFAFERQAVAVAFQGGEPTLAGMDFYNTFLELVREKNIHQIPMLLSMQTNGCAIDESWAAFLAENRFLVGVSLDGIRETHDLYRKDVAGAGTYARVIRGVHLLENAGCEYNILTVVTKAVARNIEEIYRDYITGGFYRQQYIPCMDGLQQKRGCSPYSLTPVEYEDFLKRLFNLYKRNMLNGRYIWIRRFDNWCAMAGGREPEECCLQGFCTPQLVVEANGDVFPCDFYVLDEFRMGNIRTDSILKLFSSDAARTFSGFICLPEKCGTCKWKSLCRGGCRRDYTTAGENYYCDALSGFFEDAFPEMVQIFKAWNQEKVK